MQLGISPCPQPGCLPCPLPCHGGADPARSRDWVLAGRADPGRQQSLRCGLPCPSSDSSWQLWRNVLLAAVLINGEHVCVAEIFFSSSSSVWWKYRKTVYIHYKRGGGGVYYLPIPKVSFTSDQPILGTGTSLIPGCLFLNAFTHLHPSVLHSCHTIILS